MKKEEFEEIMFSGKLYDPFNEEILRDQLSYMNDVKKYNMLEENIDNLKIKEEMIRKMFMKVGKTPYIQAPFYSNFGGKHTILGDNFYANFNLTLVDDGIIEIGNNVLIGPNVTIITAAHPISPDLRKKGIQYNLNVKIGNNVWIGAGVNILPGVIIGDNSIIGAGAVVTKNVPNDVIVVGNPAKVLRKIDDNDYKTYNHGIKIDEKFIGRGNQNGKKEEN